MAQRARNLVNPESDLDLENRKPKGARKVEEDIQRVKTGKPTELEALRERIAAVKAAPPKDDAPHCADCFQRGAIAAVRAIEE